MATTASEISLVTVESDADVVRKALTADETCAEVGLAPSPTRVLIWVDRMTFKLVVADRATVAVDREMLMLGVPAARPVDRLISPDVAEDRLVLSTVALDSTADTEALTKGAATEARLFLTVSAPAFTDETSAVTVLIGALRATMPDVPRTMVERAVETPVVTRDWDSVADDSAVLTVNTDPSADAVEISFEVVTATVDRLVSVDCAVDCSVLTLSCPVAAAAWSLVSVDNTVDRETLLEVVVDSWVTVEAA